MIINMLSVFNHVVSSFAQVIKIDLYHYLGDISAFLRYFLNFPKSLFDAILAIQSNYLYFVMLGTFS